MNKAVFLDRDGTINVEKRYVYKKEDFSYIDGVVDALKKIQVIGFLLIVVTNQSGIARGYYTEEEYVELEKWMIDDLLKQGVRISAVYHCPHYEGGVIPRYSIKCSCRKPKLGMFLQAQKDFDIDLNKSFAVGNNLTDLCLCSEFETRGILFGTDNDDKFASVQNWKEIADCNLAV